MSKTDNPTDHAHSDYNWLGFPALVAIFLAILALALSIGASCDITEHEDRLDKIECRVADNETACLRDKLDDN